MSIGKSVTLSALILFGMLAATSQVMARDSEETKPQPVQESSHMSMELDVTYDGKYIWRGINTVDGDVLQPSGTVSYGGLSFNIWANMDLDNVNGQSGDFTEVDLTLDYTWSMDPVDVSVGGIYYTFPHSGQAPSTIEMYVGAEYDAPLSPSLTWYYDTKEADGSYLSLDVGHSFDNIWRAGEDVSVGASLDASVAYGSSNFNDYYYGTDSNGFTDALFTLSFPVSMPHDFSLTPAIKYSTLLDSDIRNNMSDEDNLWAGITVSYGF